MQPPASSILKPINAIYVLYRPRVIIKNPSDVFLKCFFPHTAFYHKHLGLCQSLHGVGNIYDTSIKQR